MPILSSRSIPTPTATTDIVIVNVDVGNMPQASFKKYCDAIRLELQKVFPSNQIVILPGSVSISIFTPTP